MEARARALGPGRGVDRPHSRVAVFTLWRVVVLEETQVTQNTAHFSFHICSAATTPTTNRDSDVVPV